MTEDEAHDCGAWARRGFIGKEMCPNFSDETLTQAWYKGWDDYPKFTKEEEKQLMIRKGAI